MRLRTTMSLLLQTALASHHPDREHGDHDRHELQQHAQAHQLLGRVGRTTAHHVDEAEQQHHGNRADRDGKYELAQEDIHWGYITPRPALRHPAVLMQRSSFYPVLSDAS